MRPNQPPIIPAGTPRWQRNLGVAGLVAATPLMGLLIAVMWLVAVLNELKEPPPPREPTPRVANTTDAAGRL